MVPAERTYQGGKDVGFRSAARALRIAFAPLQWWPLSVECVHTTDDRCTPELGTRRQFKNWYRSCAAQGGSEGPCRDLISAIAERSTDACLQCTYGSFASDELRQPQVCEHGLTTCSLTSGPWRLVSRLWGAEQGPGVLQRGEAALRGGADRAILPQRDRTAGGAAARARVHAGRDRALLPS